MPIPKLVIVTGRPGSGKSTLAKELTKTLYLPVVSRDEIKEGYVNTFYVKHDKLPEDTNKIATEIFFDNIQFLLNNNVSLIAEAAFQHKVWEPQVSTFRKIANLFLIICEIDDGIAAKRHLERGINDPKREFFHGDKRVTHFKETGEILLPAEYIPPSFDVPTIKVSTLDGYDPQLSDISDQVKSFLTSNE